MNLTHLLFSFKGRAGRKSFWITTIALLLWNTGIKQMIGPFEPDHPMTGSSAIIMVINFAVVTWIGLAVQIKRWHDLDKSGEWILLNLVPIIGWLWILYECGFRPGTPGSNQYGEAPN